MAARLKRLEQQAVGRTAVVLPFLFDPLTKRLYSEPSPEQFEILVFKQQTELQIMIARMMADLAEPTVAPGIVGTEQLAPLPAGVKRPRFIEIDGREVDTHTLRRN